MTRLPCVLQTSPRVSGRLWGWDGNQAKRFSEGGVSTVEVDPQGKILEVKVKGGEKIIEAQFNSENQAVLWTEKGNIYKLNFGQNMYWKVGKPGVVSCANFQLTPANHMLVGLATGRAVIIDTETGAIRSRFVENCAILGVGGSHDGLVVFTMCRDHVTLWDMPTKQARLRLGVQTGTSLQFVQLLPGGAGYRYRVVTAARQGRVAVWGVKTGDTLELVTEVDIGGECEVFALAGDDLYVGTQTEVVKVDLVNGGSDKVTIIPRGEKLTGLDVKTFGTQTVVVLHLGTRSLFLRSGETVDQVWCGGAGCFSQDGFLMGKVTPAGAVQFYRTDGSWTKQVVKDTEKPVDRATNIGRVVTANKAVATTTKDTVDTRVGKVVDKADNVDINKAERDYDELLSQITTPTLLPLLRSGLLSYPPLPRPTIWANLLHLPRNKRIYLRFCKLNNSTPENILDNVFLWSPHLKLVPHVPSFISPFLSLFSGHPTTSFEFCLTILSQYTWLSSYPSPPSVFSLAWSLLSSSCPSLTTHLSSISVTSRTLFWPLLQSGWSTVLPNPDWAKLWDHLITAGPGLLVTALPATISCLQTILLSCSTSTMVNNLLSSQPALNMDELLTTAYCLLDKHHMLVTSAMQDKVSAGAITDTGYPPPIKLEREGREVLQDLTTTCDSSMSSNHSPRTMNHKSDVNYGKVIKAALAVSPPPIPRARTNQRADLSTRARTNQKAGLNNKENIGFKQTISEASFKPAKQRFDPLAPLQPAYPPTLPHSSQELPPPLSKPGEEGWDDITALLQKAKLLRQVIQAKN